MRRLHALHNQTNATVQGPGGGGYPDRDAGGGDPNSGPDHFEVLILPSGAMNGSNGSGSASVDNGSGGGGGGGDGRGGRGGGGGGGGGYLCRGGQGC